jgi:hypothetical protein
MLHVAAGREPSGSIQTGSISLNKNPEQISPNAMHA